MWAISWYRIIIIIIISVMELGHLLTRSGHTYPEVSSKVYHDRRMYSVIDEVSYKARSLYDQKKIKRRLVVHGYNCNCCPAFAGQQLQLYFSGYLELLAIFQNFFNLVHDYYNLKQRIRKIVNLIQFWTSVVYSN